MLIDILLTVVQVSVMIEMSKLIEGTRMIFRLKEIRTGKELSQGQLARHLEMSVPTFRRMSRQSEVNTSYKH
jgi:DNA-binding transcriptional regulator YiaG